MNEKPIIKIEGRELYLGDLTNEGVDIAHYVNSLRNEMDELAFQRMEAWRLIGNVDEQYDKVDILHDELIEKLRACVSQEHRADKADATTIAIH